MAIEIREIPLGGDLEDFLAVVDRVYADDPAYVRPLDFDTRRRLSPKHPYFEHADGAIFTAYLDGRCAGRVVAHIDHEYVKRYQQKIGFFGFYDTIDDAQVNRALLDAVVAWQRAHGSEVLRGPMTMNVAEEMGCLIDGFEHPPMLLTGHNRPYQHGLLENYGFSKTKDMYAWEYHMHGLSPRVQRAHATIAAMPEVRSREIDMRNFDADVRTILDIYNDAWQDSWGYVPITPAEAKQTAADLKLVVIPKLTRIVEIEGETAAMCFALPNLNEVIRDFSGKLLPLNWARLLWRLKLQRPSTARLVALGIRKRYRHVKRYGGLAAFLFAEMNQAGAALGFSFGELSFTREGDAPINTAIKVMGGKIYKTYRVYDLPL